MWAFYFLHIFLYNVIEDERFDDKYIFCETRSLVYSYKFNSIMVEIFLNPSDLYKALAGFPVNTLS